MTTTHRRPRLTQPDQMPTPVVDDLSATVLDEAIDTLVGLRTPYWLGDSALRLHALASVLVQGAALLPHAVAQARDQDLTWDQIGALLGLSGPAAARRYRPTTTGKGPER